MSSRDRLKALFRSDGAFWIGLGIAFLLYSFVVMPLIQGRQRSPLLAVIPICCIIAGGIMLFRPEWKNRLIGAVGAVLAVLSIYAMVGSLLARLAQEQRWDDATAIPAEVWNPAR